MLRRIMLWLFRNRQTGAQPRFVDRDGGGLRSPVMVFDGRFECHPNDRREWRAFCLGHR